MSAGKKRKKKIKTSRGELIAGARVPTVGLLRPPRQEPKKKPYSRKIKHKGGRFES